MFYIGFDGVYVVGNWFWVFVNIGVIEFDGFVNFGGCGSEIVVVGII